MGKTCVCGDDTTRIIRLASSTETRVCATFVDAGGLCVFAEDSWHTFMFCATFS